MLNGASILLVIGDRREPPPLRRRVQEGGVTEVVHNLSGGPFIGGELQWDGGPMQRAGNSPEQLMPRHVKQFFIRICGTKGRGPDGDQSSRAVEKHAGFIYPKRNLHGRWLSVEEGRHHAAGGSVSPDESRETHLESREFLCAQSASGCPLANNVGTLQA